MLPAVSNTSSSSSSNSSGGGVNSTPALSGALPNDTAAVGWVPVPAPLILLGELSDQEEQAGNKILNLRWRRDLLVVPDNAPDGHLQASANATPTHCGRLGWVGTVPHHVCTWC